MKRVAIVSAEFDGKIYDFKLYARTLFVTRDIVKIEYTEKVCDTIVRTYVIPYANNPKHIEHGMLEDATAFKARILERINSWEEVHEGDENE